MTSSQFIFMSIYMLFVITVQALPKLEFTNVVCKTLDKEFSDFEYCYLKSVNRSYKYMSLKVKLFKVPINSVTMRYTLMKKENGYKPFLYNISLDGCKFQRSPKHPVTNFIFSVFKEYTNMNHTCPYDHDLIVEKLDINHVTKKFLILPFPVGEYALHTTWFAYDIVRAESLPKLEFTNLVCETLGKEFCDFEYCYLKSVNRSYKYMSVKVKLFKVPINSVKIRYTLMKKENGYKPFLYNITLDVCEFLRSPKNPVTKFGYNLFREYTNMNHTCPYDHDLVVEKLDKNHVTKKFLMLPFPIGEYAVYMTWFAYDIPRADVKVYLTIAD